MAVTAKQKAEFLESLGEVKSLQYFMTGPNLGPDWSWSKALAGGYSTQELDTFLNKGNVAYQAHKSKDKATSAPQPSQDAPSAAGVPGVGSCAKTAAKSAVTAVSQVKTVLSQAFLKTWMSPGQVGQIDFADLKTLRSQISNLRAEVLAEVGQEAPEFVALTQADDLLAILTRLQTLEGVSDQFQAALTAGNLDDAAQFLNSVAQVRKFTAVKAQSALDEFASVVSEIDSQSVTTLFQIKTAALDQIRSVYEDLSLGLVNQVAEDALDVTIGSKAFFDDLSEAVTNAEIFGEGVMLDDLVAGLDWMSQFEGVLAGVSDDLVGLIAQSNVGASMRLYVTRYTKKLNDSLEVLTDSQGWLGGATPQPGSFLEFVQSQGAGFGSAVTDQFVFADEILEQLAGSGLGTTLKLKVDLLGDAKVAFDEAMEVAQATVPGPTPTAASVSDALDEGVEAKVKAAGTDELNPMVQAELEAEGEVPSLVYFMTKKQKQEYLLNPAFHDTDYTITYKGQKLSGKGLDTAKQKYQAKTGSVAPSGDVGKAANTTPPIAKAGADPVTNFAPVLPEGAPKWWGDTFTEKQASYLESLVTKNNLTEVFEEAGFYEMAKAGSLTKGQMSFVIDVAKQVDDEVIEVLDASVVKQALNYGEPLSVPTGQMDQAAEWLDNLKATAAQAEDVAEDVAAPVKEALNGPSVSGQAQKQATSVAPLHAGDWDAPHSFTYKGDGQSKWGGAHRKWWFEDEDGNDWMLKHGVDFRSEGELAAHKLAQAAGFDIPEARITTQKVGRTNQTGFMQRMFRKDDVEGELADFLSGGGFEALDPKLVAQIQEHQVLDWLLGNHDSHTQNFLVLRDGRVVGIDKGQAFKFYGKDKLAHDYKPAGNFGEIAYNRMWADYRAGRIDLDLDVIDDALSRVEAMSDRQIFDLVKHYSRGRFQAGSEGFLSGTAAKSSAELVDLITRRKQNIRRDFTTFYEQQAKARGVSWSPKWAKDTPKAVQAVKAKAVKAGDVLTPIDEDLVAALNRAGTAGKAVYVAGSEVEQGQILFDIMKDAQGRDVLRVNFHVRPDADARIVKLLTEESGGRVAGGSTGGSFANPGLPQKVSTAATYETVSVKAAKSINYHIQQGDFTPNPDSITQATARLAQAKDVIAKGRSKGLDPDSLPQKLIDNIVQAQGVDEQAIASLAAEVTELKAAQVYLSHLEEIVDAAGKGTAMPKVGKVPSFDAEGHFMKVKKDALARAEAGRAGSGKAVVTQEPEKVFSSVTPSRQVTSKVGGTDYRVGTYEGIGDAYGNQMYRAKTEDGWEVLYRDITTSHPTHKGWTEMIIPTDGRVTRETVDEAMDFITTKLGVQTRLAKAEDMELTYWRIVMGNYRFSKQARQATSSHARALARADANLKNLGPSPSQAEEVEAIKSGFREVFGSVVDQADYLPVHNHALADHFEEIGMGFFERPELTGEALESALKNRVVFHDAAYGGGRISVENINKATGDGLFAQQERLRYGFKVSAASAESDISGGGATGLFNRIKTAQSATARQHTVYLNPSRQFRKLGSYVAPHDTFGKLRDRTNLNTLEPSEWAKYTSGSRNELMTRHVTSWVDDIDVAILPSKQEAIQFRRIMRERLGRDELRGRKLEDRFLSIAEIRERGLSEATYIKNFYAEEARAGAYAARLRRAAEELVAGARAQASRATGAVKAAVKSRSGIKGWSGSGTGTFTKSKLSVGREYNHRVRFPNGGGAISSIRVHVSENVISMPTDQATRFGLVPEMTGGPFDEVRKAIASHPQQGQVLVLDMADLGFDLREIPARVRNNVSGAFVQALIEGDLEQWLSRWSAYAA